MHHKPQCALVSLAHVTCDNWAVLREGPALRLGAPIWSVGIITTIPTTFEKTQAPTPRRDRSKQTWVDDMGIVDPKAVFSSWRIFSFLFVKCLAISPAEESMVHLLGFARMPPKTQPSEAKKKQKEERGEQAWPV